MAENKKSFVLYSDLISVVEKLVLKDREDKTNYGGELFLHILRYVNDKKPIPIDFIIEMAFEPIKLQLKRDLEKYEVIKEKRSKAGKISAEAKKQTATHSTSVESVEQTATHSTVSDSVNENVNDNDILLEKETKEENLSKEIPIENFSDEKIDEVNPDFGKRKKVPPKKEKYFNKVDFKKRLLELGVEEADADGWIEVRRQKRAVFTENAIQLVLDECKKNNIEFSEAIKASSKYGWQGFEYEWYLNKQKNQNGQSNNQSASNGFNNNSGNSNGSFKVPGKVSATSILAGRIKSAGNSENGNVTIDAEIIE